MLRLVNFGCVIPPKHNPNRVNWYEDRIGDLNLTGITYPVPLNQIPRFEANNTNISVDVFELGESVGQYSPVYH